MALTKTLAQLKTALKQRAGVDSTGTSVDLTDTVLNELVNDALYEGWDVIVNKWADYFTKATTVPVTSGTDTYTLPTDFYKLRRLWVQDGTTYLRLYPIDLDAYHQFVGMTSSDRRYRYLMLERNLVITPMPQQNETLKLWYIPIQPELSSDVSTVTFDTPIEYKLILAIAWRDILDRQDLDPSPAAAKVQEYSAKLRTAADARDAGEPFYLDPRGPGSWVDDDLDEVL